jgi:hypothetical protein
VVVLLGSLGAALVMVLLAFTCYFTFVGLVGVLSGERFERCPYCHRHGLTVGGRLHDTECPPRFPARLPHWGQLRVHRVRHH